MKSPPPKRLNYLRDIMQCQRRTHVVEIYYKENQWKGKCAKAEISLDWSGLWKQQRRLMLSGGLMRPPCRISTFDIRWILTTKNTKQINHWLLRLYGTKGKETLLNSSSSVDFGHQKQHLLSLLIFNKVFPSWLPVVFHSLALLSPSLFRPKAIIPCLLCILRESLKLLD